MATSTSDRHLALLSTRRWLVVLTVLVFAAAGAVYSLARSPVYAADTSILLEPTTVTRGTSSQSVSGEEVATQQLVVQSQAVASRVVDELDLDEDPEDLRDAVTVEQEEEARVLRVTVQWDNPTEAAKIANGFATSYLAYRQAQQEARLEALNLSAVGDASVGEVLTLAIADDDPVGPSPIVIIVLCGLLGLLVGVVLEFLRAGRGQGRASPDPTTEPT